MLATALALLKCGARQLPAPPRQQFLGIVGTFSLQRCASSCSRGSTVAVVLRGETAKKAKLIKPIQ
jgi:hypothetical protein